jgi:hypothetical protein
MLHIPAQKLVGQVTSIDPFYNNTPSNDIVNAASNISFRPLI